MEPSKVLFEGKKVANCQILDKNFRINAKTDIFGPSKGWGEGKSSLYPIIFDQFEVELGGEGGVEVRLY